MKIDCTINGSPTVLDVSPMRRLIDLLREEMKLTGTKEGCGEGECGACTVLIDGEAVNSCLVIASQIQGRQVVTIEGLTPRSGLTPLQESFVRKGGLQCGICTPGMIVAARALLDKNLEPDALEIRTAIAGNLCRCTGYHRIVDSILEAAELERSRLSLVDTAPPDL